MNEEIQIKIIELMDDGATPESSTELKQLIDSSDEAQSFYESILVSESAIEGFFGGDKAKELSNKIDAYVDEQLNETSKVSSIFWMSSLDWSITVIEWPCSLNCFAIVNPTLPAPQIIIFIFN